MWIYIKYLLASITYILGIVGSFPPYNLGFLSWISFVPLFYLLKKIRIRYLAILLCPQLLINLLLLVWIKEIASNFYLTLSCLFALYYLFIFLIIKILLIRQRGYLIPLVLTIFEYLQTKGPFGFPFLVIGYSQYLYPKLIQFADLGGVWLISFLIYSVNYLLFVFLNKKQKKYLLIIFSIFALILVYNLKFQELPIGKIKVALIQPNINMFLSDWPGNEDYFLKYYENLTLPTKSAKPDLVIWPETAVGISIRKSRSTAKKIRLIINRINSALLLGNMDERLLSLLYKEKYNTAFYINKQGKVLGEHQKIKLIPFIEIVNYQLYLPLNIREKIKSGIFRRGSQINKFDLNDYQAAVVICYESVFGDLLQQITKKKVNIIYNLSSDGWSKNLAEHQLNYIVNIFRAVENRLYVVRISDTGISGIISPRGETLAMIPAFKKGYLIKDVPLLKNYSFYAEHGDIFIYLLIFFCFFETIYKYIFSKLKLPEK